MLPVARLCINLFRGQWAEFRGLGYGCVVFEISLFGLTIIKYYFNLLSILLRVFYEINRKRT